jgi:hypothetical protein
MALCAVRDLGRMVLIPLPDAAKRNLLSYSKNQIISLGNPCNEFLARHSNKP